MLQFSPDRETFRSLASQGNLIPVVADLLGDTMTPVSAYARLSQEKPAFLFESVEGGERLNRYSFLGGCPRKIFAVGEQTTRIIVGPEIEEVPTPQDPLELVREELAHFHPVNLPQMPPFLGGAVGFLGYEYVHRIEPSVPRPQEDVPGTPMLYFMMVDSLVVFDRAHQTVRLCAYGHIDAAGVDAAYDRACEEIEKLFARLDRPSPVRATPICHSALPELPAGNMTRERFEAAVEKTKEYVCAGDIVQAVLSQRFILPYEGSPLDLYRALRTVNPSPYMFILETPDFSLVGASPEVHVRLTGDRVEIRPIAGTRPRGRTGAEDRQMEEDLLADEKERAEHLMLVDLARNDIGRVCRYGTVSVEEFMVIERYSHVMHIVSQVEGRLSPRHDAFDLMRATFPAGTVSGAPKVRAMQIISELEDTVRGPYAGALGYFAYGGNLDSCIAIRTALIRDGQLFLQSGAGVVADSSPSGEFTETINKAKGLLKSVGLSQTL